MRSGGGKRASRRLSPTLKSMILGALEDAGGRAYLASQAAKTPSAFLTLVAKILPAETPAGDAFDPEPPTITVTIATEPPSAS